MCVGNVLTGGEAQKLEAETILVGDFPRQLTVHFFLLYELQYQIVVQIGAQRKCLGEETLLSARGRKLLPHTGRAICAQGFPYLGLHMFTFNQTC